ncbi:uncharacterized protein LOC121239524 [Juglans microcarpa x Juglans regia]|uniref:uncharacterized protein LOC121239524 n=1 Tax=Juglans microcarpa x Juglans regia TaxID=2249226 RepID=UPI001B7E3E4C|nr:uncharacterized protein LOC121239524 [Juglans microcarpa x Juglans regia]
MQGQLRALQKDMATIVAFVGSLKESEGADKLKDDGLSFTRKKAQQKGKYNKGWNVWRRAKSQEHFGAWPSDVKAHGIGPQPKAHSGGSLSRTQLNGSGSGPTELAKPSSSPIHSIELHGLGFVPDSIQTAPIEVVGVAGVVLPESCAQNPLLGVEAKVPSALENQSSRMREAGVSLIPAAGSGRLVEDLELAEVEEDSDDFMHSVEDELFITCGSEDFSMGSEFQNQNNKMGNPTPLNYYFPDQASDWVIHKAKEIQHVVGVECVGYEEQFIALLTAM